MKNLILKQYLIYIESISKEINRYLKLIESSDFKIFDNDIFELERLTEEYDVEMNNLENHFNENDVKIIELISNSSVKALSILDSRDGEEIHKSLQIFDKTISDLREELEEFLS